MPLYHACAKEGSDIGETGTCLFPDIMGQIRLAVDFDIMGPNYAIFVMSSHTVCSIMAG